MTVNLKFKLAEIVYHKTNGSSPGVITGFMIRPGVTLYYVTWDDLTERGHYDFELTNEKSYKTESGDDTVTTE